jgi:hypothetical protein
MPGLTLVSGTTAWPGIEYWEARAATPSGPVHVGSIHEFDGLWVPVCRAGHRLPGSVEVSTAAATLQHHLTSGCTRTTAR